MSAKPSDRTPQVEEIRKHVRELLLAEIGSESAAATSTPSPNPPRERQRFGRAEIVTESDVERRRRRGESLEFPDGTRFTPLAEDLLSRIEKSVNPSASGRPTTTQPNSPLPKEPTHSPRAAAPLQETVAVGSDHGGFSFKAQIIEHLTERGFQVLDCGTKSAEACDYPVFARAVGEAIRSQAATAGIVVDGAGIGSAMTVNKLSGVRAAHCHNVVEARNAREHNHAHVLTLGSGIVGWALAREIIDTFLATPFAPGRHARRVAMIESESNTATGSAR